MSILKATELEYDQVVYTIDLYNNEMLNVSKEMTNLNILSNVAEYNKKVDQYNDLIRRIKLLQDEQEELGHSLSKFYTITDLFQ